MSNPTAIHVVASRQDDNALCGFPRDKMAWQPTTLGGVCRFLRGMPPQTRGNTQGGKALTTATTEATYNIDWGTGVIRFTCPTCKAESQTSRGYLWATYNGESTAVFCPCGEAIPIYAEERI